MDLEITGRGLPITDDLRSATERHVQRSLARFAHRIRAVTVRFTDLNGHRGGVDVRCRLEAMVDGSGRIVVHETHESPRVAIARASEVAALGVSRRVSRARDLRRREARLRELRRRHRGEPAR